MTDFRSTIVESRTDRTPKLLEKPRPAGLAFELQTRMIEYLIEKDREWREWLRLLKLSQVYDAKVDDWMRPLLRAPTRSNWLASLRLASLSSIRDIAKRLRIPASSYQNWEKRELNGKMTLNELYTIAKAYDCDLIYGFKPRDGILPSRKIFDQIARDLKFCPYRSIPVRAAEKFRSPEYRRSRGWIRNRRKELT